jgi:thioredoxin
MKLPIVIQKNSQYIVSVFLALLVAAFYFTGKNSSSDKTVTRESTMEHLTLDSFKNKICECGIGGTSNAAWNYKGTVPAVIDFYADWCGPCKMVAPILEQLSGEYEGRLNIYKVNTENERDLAALFGISSIPSILFIPVDGKPQMVSGALPKNEFKRMFREILGVEEPVVPQVSDAR